MSTPEGRDDLVESRLLAIAEGFRDNAVSMLRHDRERQAEWIEQAAREIARLREANDRLRAMVVELDNARSAAERRAHKALIPKRRARSALGTETPGDNG